jgi:hypothetical protein
MSATFKPNSAGFRAMAVGPEIRAALRQVAEVGKEIAEELAQDFRVTGEYADSFEVSDETIEWQGRFSGPRAAARLTNTAPHAAAVEWGNEHSHRNHRVLGRTLDRLARG